MRGVLVVGPPLLALAACSPRPTQPRHTEAGPVPAQPGICAPSRLAFSLDDGNGRFNGMSHSGTMLVLRNTGTSPCTIPAQPLANLVDANRQALNLVAQDSPGSPPAPTSITIAPGATVTSDMRWVSGNVYEHGHCVSPAIIALTLGPQTVSTAFAGHLCGPGGKPSTYTLTPFRPGAVNDAVATADANTLSYRCADGRTVQAIYPDTETAVLTLDGQTYRLHIAISADGALRGQALAMVDEGHDQGLARTAQAGRKHRFGQRRGLRDILSQPDLRRYVWSRPPQEIPALFPRHQTAAHGLRDRIAERSGLIPAATRG